MVNLNFTTNQALWGLWVERERQVVGGLPTGKIYFLITVVINSSISLLQVRNEVYQTLFALKSLTSLILVLF